MSKKPSKPSTTASEDSSPRIIPLEFDAPLPPTAKQLAFIEEIETYVNVPFTGTTREDASTYISENIDDFRDARRADEEGEEWLPDRGWDFYGRGFDSVY